MKNKGGRPETHGYARRGVKRPREYNCWMHMIGRCTNKNHMRFPEYGAMGITVCERWRKFQNFIDDMGFAPSKIHTLDRYPNQKGNYEPGNVRWATPTQQARNTSKNRMITHEGETLCATEWAERFGVWPATIIYRDAEGLNISQPRKRKKVRRVSIANGSETIFNTIEDAVNEMNISKSAISNVLCGIRESSCGYYWEYQIAP